MRPITLSAIVIAGCLFGCKTGGHPIPDFQKESMDKAVERLDELPAIRASVKDGVHRRLQFAKTKHKDLSEFKYIEMNQGSLTAKTRRMDISQDSYIFDSGKSYYIAFELPEFKRPYDIKTYTYINPGKTPNPFFYPKILLLDRKFAPIRLVDTNTRMVPYEFLILSGSVHINNSREKYAILLTTDEVMRSSTTTLSKVNTGYVMSGGMVFPSGFEYIRAIREHSPEGKVLVFWE